MVARCARWTLLLVGVLLMVSALLPVSVWVPIPEQYDTAFISSKLLMLPVGAFCLWGASSLGARLSRR